MFDSIRTNSARLSNQLNCFEYPSVLPLKPPTYWENIPNRQKYYFPPFTLYYWFMRLFSTQRDRIENWHIEHLGSTETQFDNWWEINEESVKDWKV